MYKQSSAWVSRIKSARPVGHSEYYSVAGAAFQEYCLSHLDHKGSIAHSAIGRLVTAINQGIMPVDVAQAIYNGLLTREG